MHRVLLLDIETAPNVGYTWGKWEQNVIEFVEQWYILSFAYKWLGERTEVRALCDVGGSEKRLMREIRALLDEADVVVAQNGDAFDIKKINTRLLFHKLSPPSPYKTVDTKKVAKARFAFNSNSLDAMGADLDEGRKLKHRGFQLWKDVMAGSLRAWAEMKIYNKQDVDLLERIYLRFRPWVKNHPSLATRQRQCKACQSFHVQSRGTRITATRKYERYQCQDCAFWMDVPITKERPDERRKKVRR